jgi:tyrosyl-tRNA synthetase
MLEREDFRSRLEKNLPISVHELLYPLLTAYDAVALESDVELGATEQKFNMLVHRDIQREYGKASEVVLTMPILVGLDGERKMSKSLGNYVGIAESPGEMFGKLMSISDELMWLYYELLTDFASPVIVRLRDEVRTGVLHPKKAKTELAHVIVAQFHGEEAARKAAEEFQRVFSERKLPEEITLYRILGVTGESAMLHKQVGAIVDTTVPWPIPVSQKMKWAKLLVALGEIPSVAEAERLIKQGAFEIDGTRVEDVRKEIDLSKPGEFLLRAGKKKFLRVIVE